MNTILLGGKQDVISEFCVLLSVLINGALSFLQEPETIDL